MTRPVRRRPALAVIGLAAAAALLWLAGRAGAGWVVAGRDRFTMALAVAAVTVAIATAAIARWGRRPLTARAAGWTLAGLLLVMAATRLVYVNEPLERDLMVYTTVAEGMLDGRPLYVEMWDHKPPAVHLTYAAAVALFGGRPVTIWLLGFVAAGLTAWSCYQAGRLTAGRLAGVVAAAVWALGSGDLLLQANQPNVEVFMNVCLAAAFVLGLRALVTDSWRLATGSGALFFAATLYKPVVAVTACTVVGMTALLAVVRRHANGAPPRTAVRVPLYHLALAAGVATLGWAATAGLLWIDGSLPAFVEAVIDYNRDYAGDIQGNVLRGLLPPVDAVAPLLPYAPLLMIAALAGVVAAVNRRLAPHWLLLLAYVGGAWVAVTLPGRLYPHYFQLMLPPAAIAAGWLVQLAAKQRTWLLTAAAVAALYAPVAARVYQESVPMADVSAFKYGGYGHDLVETQRMSRWVNSVAGPGDVVYHWGPDPGVYFYAGRTSPVGFVFNLPLLDGTARAARFSARVLAELEARPPALVVARRLDMRRIDNPVEVWIEQHYEPIEGPPGVSTFVFLKPRRTASPGTRPVMREAAVHGRPHR